MMAQRVGCWDWSIPPGWRSILITLYPQALHSLGPQQTVSNGCEAGWLGEMARPFSAELKAKVRKDTGCTQILLQQPRGSSGLRTECGWDQEGKDNWKKMETGRRVGGGASAKKPRLAGGITVALSWALPVAPSLEDSVAWCSDVWRPVSLG